MAGTDLERTRGIRRGPASWGGGAPPRHDGWPRGDTDHCLRLSRVPIPCQRGSGACHPGVGPRAGPLSCLWQSGYFATDRGGPRLYLCAPGDLAEGRALLEEGISESIRTGALQRPLWVAWLSEVCRLAGRGEEAWQHARQALDLARQQKERGNEAVALHQLGVVQAHANPPDVAQAEAYYQQALALAKELGMRPLMAHCHLGLGTLYTKMGRREQARAELSTAIELYRAMDMTFWLPQAEAVLAQVV